MRLLANENIPRLVVADLRKSGHDVLWVRESRPGISDEEVLSLGIATSSVLLTFDKDFGELVFRRGRSASCGVVLFRIQMSSPQAAAESIVSVIASRNDWVGHFSVVDEDRIRLIPLPPT
jgi:predicted nuclease of predicted toxin-antitoxin system